MKKIINCIFLIGIISALIHFPYRYKIFMFLTIVCGIILLFIYLVIKSKKYYSTIIFISLFIMFLLIKLLYLQKIGYITSILLLIAHIGYAIFLVENKKSFNVIRTAYIILFLFL